MKTKITIITFLTILITTNLNSQNSNFSYGLEVNLGILTPTYIFNGSFPSNVQNSIKENDNSKHGYEFGLIAEYKIAKRIGIQSGLKYQKWSYENRSTELVLPGNFFDPVIIIESDNTYENTNFEIPIQSNFYFNIKSVNLLLRTGLSTSINIRNLKITEANYSEITSGSIDRIEVTSEEDKSTSFRRTNINAEIGLGFLISFSEKINVCILPNVKTQSYGIYKNAPLNRRMLFYGISTIAKIN